jgi:hypothetical protein
MDGNKYEYEYEYETKEGERYSNGLHQDTVLLMSFCISTS